MTGCCRAICASRLRTRYDIRMGLIERRPEIATSVRASNCPAFTRWLSATKTSAIYPDTFGEMIIESVFT